MPADGGSSGGYGNSFAGIGSAVARVAKRTVKAARRTSGGSGTSRRSRSSGRISRRSSGSSGRSSNYSSGSSRRHSSGGGGNSGGGGGGGYTPPKPKPAPKPPSINDYLGTDSVYQNAVRGGKRSLADFLSELGRRRGEAGTQFKQTTASMERDRVQQLDDLRNEFASRGLIQSGLYGQEQGTFQKKFGEQQTALKQQQAALLADLLGQQKNYQRENDLATEAAKQEALMRRAAKYKIGA
jgi:hypothetical protein